MAFNWSIGETQDREYHILVIVCGESVLINEIKEKSFLIRRWILQEIREGKSYSDKKIR